MDAAPDPAMLACAEQLLLACAHGQQALALGALARLQSLAAGPACTIVQLDDEAEGGQEQGTQQQQQQQQQQADELETGSATLAFAVNIIDAHGATPLLHATRTRMAGVVEQLVAAGARAGAGQLVDSGNSALHMAATHGDAHAVKALLSALLAEGERPDAPNVNADTPLHFAAACGSVPVGVLLLRAGAAPGTPNAEGITPLMAASAAGRHLLVQVLLRHAAGMAAGGGSGSGGVGGGGGGSTGGGIGDAASNGVSGSGSTGVSSDGAGGSSGGGSGSGGAGALLAAVDDQGNSALHYASRAAHVECVRALLDAGAPVGCRNARGSSPLIEARAALGAAQTAARAASAADVGETGAEQGGGAAAAAAAAEERAVACERLLLAGTSIAASSIGANANASNASSSSAGSSSRSSSSSSSSSSASADASTSSGSSAGSVGTTRSGGASGTGITTSSSSNASRCTGSSSSSSSSTTTTNSGDPSAGDSADALLLERWPAAALARAERDSPGVSDLDVQPQHVMGLGLDRLSMAQLDALETLHMAAMSRINEARVALAREQERTLNDCPPPPAEFATKRAKANAMPVLGASPSAGSDNEARHKRLAKGKAAFRARWKKDPRYVRIRASFLDFYDLQWR
ncbi:hypothetical protein FOA52_016185 [Chlamydomonas sp. UWO 241]|nr:hypothetical protein FOA52_016185 [Chlamydomonas sp. UWO 241]